MVRQIHLILIALFVSAAGADAEENGKVIHVLVALCDNQYQGIVKVAKSLGDGDNTETNLYWGSSGGVRETFCRSSHWKLLNVTRNPRPGVLERAVFLHQASNTILVADGYRGRHIRNTLEDFFSLLAGRPIENEYEQIPQLKKTIHAGSHAALIVYVGHNGLMDIAFNTFPSGHSDKEAIVLCCVSQEYFQPLLHRYGARPILLTTQLMYPGAMILEEAFAGWIRQETPEQIRIRAGKAYAKNQAISIKAGIGVFSKLHN